MKKLLLLLFALVTAMGAWAETVTVTTESALWSTTGTLGYNGSENWAVSWTSSNEKVKITCPANGHIYKKSSQMGTNTFTIWTPGTEMITGFTLTFTSSAASNCTVTSGLVSKTSTGTSNEQTLSISGIFAHFVKITVSGNYANVSAFSINYTSMPAKSATGYYLIKGNWPTNNYLYANSSNATKLWKNWHITDESSLYFDANYVWQIDEYGDYRSLYNVGASRYVSNFTTANSSSASKSGADVNLLNATEFSDAELFVLTNDLNGNSLTGAKAYKACSKSSNCFLDNYSESNDYTGFHNAAHKGNAFLPTRVYKVTFKAADDNGTEIDGQVLVNGTLTNAIYVPASTTLTSIGGSKFFIGGEEKTESEVKTAVNGVTNDSLVVYVTPTPTTITINFKQGETTIATKEFSAKNGYEYNIVSTLGFQSRYMSTDPATVTGTSSDQEINVETTFTLPFTVCSNPATDETMSRVYYLILHNKYAHRDGLSTSLDRDDKDYFWTFGGDYINGFTIYNKGQESYMSNGSANGSTSTFNGSSTKYLLYSNTNSGFYLKVKGSDNNYLNDNGGTFSTWTCGGYDLPTWVSGNEDYYGGCFIKIKDVASDMSEVYTYLNLATIGSSLNQYSSSSYTDSDRSTALSNALTVHSSGTVYELASAANDLWAIKNDLTLNMPSTPLFLRIRSSQNARAYLQSANASTRMKVSTTTDKETIFLYDTSKKLISYSKGLVVNNVREMGTVGDAGNTFEVIAAVSGNLGQYSIKCNDGGSYNDTYLYSTGENNTNADRNTYSDSFKQQNSFTLEAVTSLPVSISEAGYASFNSPVAVEIPEGVTAYVLSGVNESSLSLTSIKDGIIPANTAVVLKGNEGNYNFNISSEAGTATSAFSGTIAAISVESGKNYTLQNGTYGVAFYILNSTSIPGFKAYYPKPVSGVKALTFVFDTETGIDTRILEQTGEKVYDLQGRLVEKAGKGIYIVNGKKVFVK